MHPNPIFRKTDTERSIAFAREQAFGMVAVNADPSPLLAHVPFILSEDGATPPAYAQGWKDMVHVDGGWSEVLVTFNYEAAEDTPYMYHCHILEHEDCGMMGQFTVT